MMWDISVYCLIATTSQNKVDKTFQKSDSDITLLTKYVMF